MNESGSNYEYYLGGGERVQFDWNRMNSRSLPQRASRTRDFCAREYSLVLARKFELTFFSSKHAGGHHTVHEVRCFNELI